MSLLFSIIQLLKKGKNAFPLEIPFTTNEIRIGTWIDGKPLYRKVIQISALLNNNNKNIPIDNSYVIKDFTVIISNGTYKMKLPIPGNNPVSAFLDCGHNQQYLVIQSTSDRTSFNDNYAILEYTKTTD